MKQTGFAHILLILLLLVGLGVGVYLVQQKTNILPKAAEEVSAPTTSFKLVPEANSVAVNGQIKVDIEARSDIDPATLFSPILNFDKEMLAVDKIDYSTDTFSWAEQYFKNETGEIRLSGAVSGAGLKTDTSTDASKKKTMATIYFKALKAGSTVISFTDDSVIYRKVDDSGTGNMNILTKKDPITLTINQAEAAVNSPAPGTSDDWVSPDRISDPGDRWRRTENVYDGNTVTGAGGDRISGVACNGANNALIFDNCWTDYLYLLINPINTDKIKHFSTRESVAKIDIDVYKDGAWVDVYEGPFTGGVWEEKSFTVGIVAQARVRYFDAHFAGNLLNEFQFLSLGSSSAAISPTPQVSATFTPAPTSVPAPSVTPVATATPVPTVTKAPGVTLRPGTGDVNNDGILDKKDLAILLAYYGKPNFPPEIDMDGNGVFNVRDRTLMVELLVQNGKIKR